MLVCEDMLESVELNNEINEFNIYINNMNLEIYNEYADYSANLITESSVLDKLGIFFAKLIDKIQKTITTIKLIIERRITEMVTRGKLAKLRRELSDMKNNKVTQVKVIDYWYLRDRYYVALKELKDLGLRLSRIDYTNSDDMDADLKKWNALKEKHDEIIKRAANKEVKVPIDKMIQFVDHELGKEEGLFDTLNDLSDLYKAMEANVRSIQNRTKIVGTSTVIKHRDPDVGLSIDQAFIVKNIATFIANWASDTVVWMINQVLFKFIGFIS